MKICNALSANIKNSTILKERRKICLLSCSSYLICQTHVPHIHYMIQYDNIYDFRNMFFDTNGKVYLL